MEPINKNQLCRHGNLFYCGLCGAEKAPKCKHGNPFYCGLCCAETGDGRVGYIGKEIINGTPK